MGNGTLVRVLLVEDDEDDFILTRDLFGEMPGQGYSVDWAKTFEAGLNALARNQHDICLVDYRLGPHNGVDFVRAAVKAGYQTPLILLTGAAAHQIDMAAMQAGAADYLVKGQFRADSLERSVRYAVQRQRAAAQAAADQARLAAFGAEVGLALTRRDSLEAILERCGRAICQYLHVAACRIATLNVAGTTFEDRVTIINSSEPSPTPAVLPALRLEIASFASGQPVVIEPLEGDPRLAEAAEARRAGLVSYAAYPLLLEDKLVGLISLFTRQPIGPQLLQELSSVSNGIALCIERKRSAEALDRSELKYRAVVEGIKEVIFQLDQEGNWTFLNPAWTAVTSFEVKSTLGTCFLGYIYPEDVEHNQQVFGKLLEGHLDFCRYETRLVTKNGQVRWIEIFLQPNLEKNGNLAGISGTLTDISERKAAEVQIQKLAAFPKLSPNPVLEFSNEGTLSYANEAAHELKRKLGREDLLSILPPNTGALVRECLASGKRKLQQEVTIKEHIVTWSFFPIASSQVVHCYGADVTDLLSLEAQLRHAQRLESIGQLAAGVAHDFNNLLTVIQGYAECLIYRPGADEFTRNALKQVTKAATRAASLTRQLLLFSRKQVMQASALNLNAVLQNLFTMLTRVLGEDIEFTSALASDLAGVEADPGMLEQVVMNLAVNARDAMPTGGHLHVATRNIEIDVETASKNADARPGRFVCLEVSDTGCGMDRETLERIFEPFFTTKEVGKGSGLGLATVYGIIKQHKGWIEVSSTVGQGTLFRILLPATLRVEPPAEAPAPKSGAHPGGTETILLVEDEPAVRQLVCEVLKRQNYHVLEAGSGVAALQVWDKAESPIDLLLTDMVMPEGMSGRELATQLLSRKPSLKVIFSSGYDPERVCADCKIDEGLFLAKPYDLSLLATTVRRVLDSPAEQAGAA